MNKIWIVSIVSLALWSGCQNTQQGSVETFAEKEAPGISENATIYQLDSDYSVVTWIGSKPTGQHDGIIPVDSGFIAIDSGAIKGGKIIMNIAKLQVMDIPLEDEGHSKLTNHLMSDDFFAADSFPTSTFELTSVLKFDTALLEEDKPQFETNNKPARLSEFMVKDPSHIIFGNLTMRGITKNISFPGRITVQDTLLFAEAKFNIDRTDWNLSYSNEATVENKAKDRFIYNTVNVGFKIKALKADSVR